MSAPQLEIALDKIEHNARKLIAFYGSKGINITAITKSVCGSLEIANVLLKSGIKSLGDSRLVNIRRMREAGLNAEFILIRPPMLSEVEQVIELADISLNTEISVIRRLAEYATKQKKCHQIILMIEMGDLREGILPADVKPMVEEILMLKGIQLIGIGTNLACFGGIKPTEIKMQELSLIAAKIRHEYGIDLKIISGGNSANYQWFLSTSNVGLINHLRIGEAILLGCDTMPRKAIPGLYTDAFTLVAEIIEVKTKPSLPYGEIVQDAFGHTPIFVDKGHIKRAILALGEQDVDASSIKPKIDADILGANSDQLILNIRNPNLTAGMKIQFEVKYSALLRLMTSPYVQKIYL
jgi:predicted amino acid racemase